MNTYYIPTSTLNFNNIFSTESISPKSFYLERGFGYGRWQMVEENRFGDIILLYDIAHEFSRPASDVEDHPMLIEIQTEECFDKIQDGVYKSEHTIYLDPLHTRIIFFSEEDKRMTLIRSENSLETKMVHLYERCLVVKRYKGTFPPIDSRTIGDSPRKDEFINEDRMINKMKGLLYGYYIGALLSTTAEKIEKISILREINNIFMSILSSPSRAPSSEQRRRLNDLFDSLKFTIPLLNAFKKKFGKKTTEEIISTAAEHGYTFYQLPVLSELLDTMQKTITYGYGKSTNNIQEESKKLTPIEWINKELRDTQSEIEISIKRPSVNDNIELIISNKKLYDISCLKNCILKDLYIECINNIFSSSKYNGKISTFRAVLADAITYKARDICGSEWQSSNIRTYLNELRRHIAGEEFFQTWDNGPLSSIAAVLIKGDDWEALLQFMQSKKMYDYRLAFSIYGTLNGFSNLTRDFTDNLITLERKYVWDVYKEFYGEIFGKKLTLEKSAGVSICESLQPSRYEPGNNHTYGCEGQTVDNDKSHISQVYPQSKDKFTAEVKNDGWEEICEQILSFFDEKIKVKTKKEKERLRNSLTDVLRQHFSFRTAFDALLRKEGWHTPKGRISNSYKELYKYFSQYKISRKIGDAQSYGSLLTNTIWIEECCKFIQTEEAKKEFRERAKFLVKNHLNPTGKYKSDYKDNKSVREHFIDKMIPAYYKNSKLVHLVQEMNLDKIKEYLEQKYGN